jgi:nicotinamidase-related amidase
VFSLATYSAPRVRPLSWLLKAIVASVGLTSAQLSLGTEATLEAHPTIRAMSGATPITRFDPASTALLVIDFQNEYFSGRMPIDDGMQALKNTRRLIEFADQSRIAVYHVQHVAPVGSAVFALEGEGVKFHPLMQPRAGDVVVQKSNVSAFVGTDLDARLKKAKVKTLIISGLMTHACVAGAARDAAPAGYNVVVASDAAATRAITRVGGQTVSKDELHRAALAEIEDTFGDVLTTDQIIALPTR